MKLHPATRGHLCSRDLPCILGALAALVAFVLCGQAHCLAQCEEGWLPGRKFPGFSGALNVMVPLPNGDIIVGGSFSAPDGGTPAGAIDSFARLNDQSLFVTGTFTGIAGAPSSYVGRYAFGSPRIASPYYLIEVCPGFNQSFNAGALGLQPMQFHWRFGGVLIDPTENPSAVTPHLTLSNIQASDAGVYDCIVTNECGPITSGPSQITLLPAYLQFCGGPGCDADVNQDGVTDQGDVDALINIIAGGGNPSGIDPDFNHDGVGDQGDIDALINVIAGGVCP